MKMNKAEYCKKIEDSIKEILYEKVLFKNFKSQVFAYRLGAQFNKTFKEDYLWQNALFLSTNGCILLRNSINKKLAIEALKECGEVYEYLSTISKKYDKDYCALLAAICYDIAGYQANAFCIVKDLESYIFENTDLDHDLTAENQIIFNIHQLLLKKLPFAHASMESSQSKDQGYILFKEAINSFYNHALFGEQKNDFLELMKKTYSHYLQEGNVNISHLLFMLIVRLEKYNERSIWFNLKGKNQHSVWNKYIKLLTNDVYDSFTFKNIEKRVSKFEFWLSQLNAIHSGLLSEEKENFVIQMPTSAGKTFIAEMAIVDSLTREPDKKCIYIAPFRALTNEKEYELSRYLSKLGYSISTVSGSYEFDETQNFGIEDTDVLIATPEKVDMLLRLKPEFINNISLVIVDEGHIIGGSDDLKLPIKIEIEDIKNHIEKLDSETLELINQNYFVTKDKKYWIRKRTVTESSASKIIQALTSINFLEVDFEERSSLLEFLIIKLKRRIKDFRVLFISAVIPNNNAKELSLWVSSNEDNVISSPDYLEGKPWEPTKKIVGKFSWSKDDKGRIDYPEIIVDDKKKNNAFVPSIIKKETFKYINPDTKRKNTKRFPETNNKSQTCAALAYKLATLDDSNCLIFCPKPDWTESIGKAFLDYFDICKKIDKKIADCFNKNTDTESFFWAKQWYGETHVITQCIKHGIGIHYSNIVDVVKRAVEEDFKDGNLKILIATNTVGQGLNFPIRNVIVHSLDINPEKEKFISVRDFWNIAGRAGRAGQETEGQVIFITLNERDEEIYSKYSNKENIEEVKSPFSILLQQLVSERITVNTFLHYLEILAEPHLLSDLIEETVETDHEQLVEDIIGNSLFKIQSVSVEEKLKDIKLGFEKNLTKVLNEVPDYNLRRSFSKTGLCLDSNKKILKYIEDNWKSLIIAIEKDDYEVILQHALEVIIQNNIKEMSLYKVKNIDELQKDKLIILINMWMNGESIGKLRSYWVKEIKSNILDFYNFIGEGLTYKYPWGITAFSIIMLDKLQIQRESLMDNIKNLTTYVKYGVNDELACLGMSIGIKTREVALKISSEYKHLMKVSSGFNSTFYEDYILWFSSITKEDVVQWNLNTFDETNIIEVALKLNVKKGLNNIQQVTPQNFSFWIKGIYYELSRRSISKQIKMGDLLTYKREYENQYDPYALAVYHCDEMLGYVPRQHAKGIATEIDLNNKKYFVRVSDIDETKEFNNIKVLMYELFTV